MAIDADLNAGLLTSEDAKNRREEIAKEADFYGAMDGASKFVRGDAVAGLLILIINLVGGLLIGLLQYEMTLSDAARAYILLTIGDGLVAQLPALHRRQRGHEGPPKSGWTYPQGHRAPGWLGPHPSRRDPVITNNTRQRTTGPTNQMRQDQLV